MTDPQQDALRELAASIFGTESGHESTLAGTDPDNTDDTDMRAFARALFATDSDN